MKKFNRYCQIFLTNVFWVPQQASCAINGNKWIVQTATKSLLPLLHSMLKFLSSRNGSLVSLISHKSQGKMLVWFNRCAKTIEMLSNVISSHHCCAFTTVFFIFTFSSCHEREKRGPVNTSEWAN